MSASTLKVGTVALAMGVALFGHGVVAADQQRPQAAATLPQPTSLAQLLGRIPVLPTTLLEADRLVNENQQLPPLVALEAGLAAHRAAMEAILATSDERVRTRVGLNPTAAQATQGVEAVGTALGIDMARAQTDKAYAKQMQAKMKAMSPSELMAAAMGMQEAMGMGRASDAVDDPPAVKAAAEAGRALLIPDSRAAAEAASERRWAEAARKVAAIEAKHAAATAKYPPLVRCDGEGGGGERCQAALARYLAAVPQMMQLVYARDAEVLKVEAAAFAEERAVVTMEVRRADDLLRAAEYGAPSQEVGNPVHIGMLDAHAVNLIGALARKFGGIVTRAAFATHCGPKYLGRRGPSVGHPRLLRAEVTRGATNRRSWGVAGCAVAWAMAVALVRAMPGAPVPEQVHGGPKMKRIVTGRDMDSMDRDAAATAQTCQECHGARGWQVPPAEFSFGGKDAITLCKQLKGHFGSDGGREAARDFTTHIGNDTFVNIAFQGTRGLTEFGKAFFEADSGRPYRPEPPAASHSSVIRAAGEWAEAMEGKFRGNEACGCIPERYNIIIEESLYREVGMGPTNIVYRGSTKVTIPLVFNADGTFTAEAKSTRTIRADITGPTPCVQSAELPVTWRITGRLIEGNVAANQVVQMDITFSAPAAHGTSSCGDEGPDIRPIDSRTFDNPLRRVTVPAYSVAISETYHVGEPGAPKSNVTVYIEKEKQP